MVRGPEIVKFMEDFDQMIYVKNFHVKKTGQLIIGQAHGDHIVKLPEGGTLNGSSKSPKIEADTLGN